jgi:hypothetical protein
MATRRFNQPINISQFARAMETVVLHIHAVTDYGYFLCMPAERFESERKSPEPISLGEGLLSLAGSTSSAIATRAAVLAATGKLDSSMVRIERTLGSMPSSMGPQFVERIAEMRGQGWQIGAVPRSILSPGAGAEMAIDTRMLGYPKMPKVDYILGLGPNPYPELVSRVAHELGHFDGIKTPPDLQTFSPAESRIVAFRRLASETNAILGQVHVENTFKWNADSAPMMEAMRSRNLGGYIHRQWKEAYPSFSSISETEAKTFVNGYVEARFKTSPINAVTGEVRAFDLKKAIPAEFFKEPLPVDGAIAEMLKGDAYKAQRELCGLTESSRASKFFAETRGGTFLAEAGKTLGVLGALAAINEMRFGFHKSAGHGVGAAGQIALGYGGFELGTLVGRILISATPARPLKILAAGMAGAFVADQLIGKPVNSALQQTIDGG